MRRTAEENRSIAVKGAAIVGMMALSLGVMFSGPAGGTPLDDYVAAPDGNYAYTLVNTIPGTGWTAYVYDMTSQAWRDLSEVDRTNWQHWVIVIVPDTVSHTTAFLWIDGGSNGGSAPTSVNGTFTTIATTTNTITIDLRMIPNQPIYFADETVPEYIANGRVEDAQIAYTWDKFRTTADATWLSRCPMTKAAVRAMDLVQTEYPATTDFVVSGGSKRGWTTWTVGAVDPRVSAIAPASIDVLNVEHSMQHHWDAYGYWADAIGDYEEMGIMNWLHTPEFRDMMAIVDPYSYIERLTMPKYIANSTGDEFFLPDSSQFYFEALKGEKFLRYSPNTNHSQGQSNQPWYDLLAFYEAFLNGTPRPEFTWTREPDGSLHVQTDPGSPPTAVLMWQASNPTARNFRLDTIGAAWTSSALTDQGGGLYIGSVPVPSQGWTAFMVELQYASGGTYPFMFTTDVSVVPETMPFRNPGGWGTLETVGEGTDTISLVHVGGDRYEMGYWYGRLVGDEIAACGQAMLDYVAPSPDFTEAKFDEAIEAMWKADHFDIVEYECELRGMADGCVDAGFPEVTYRVLQKLAVLVDMSEHSCGLYALWGNATENGDLYQMRNLDWIMDAGIQNYPVVVVYHPDDGNLHGAITFAGAIGAGGGGINEYGLAVSEIMGHFCDPETLDGMPFPLMLREALYHDTTLAEALDRVANTTRTNQYHYALACPSAPDPEGRLLFTSHDNIWTFGDESVVGHPCVSPDPFHTSLDDVIYWKNHNGSGNLNLYNAINARYGSIDAQGAIEIAQADGVSGTVLSIVYHNNVNEFYVAFAEGMDPAQNQEYVHFSLEGPEAIGGSGYRTSVGTGTEEIPVIVVSGTPYEMGYHYGQLMKDEIQAFLPGFLAYAQLADPAKFSDANLDAAWADCAPYTDDRYEDELAGLAAGADLDYLSVRRAHCVAMLDSFSCSSIAAWDTATADGHLYETRDLDWDLSAGAHDYPLIVVYMPESGNAHANVTFSGNVGSHTGLSVAGIALAEMGDSPGSESPYDLSGEHFLTMFRRIMYDADSLTEALDILTNAERIKRYHYVFGDGRNELAGAKIKAHAPETPPDDLLIWTDNDSTDEFYPEVLADVVYNDEGRGAYATLSAQHGTLDSAKMIDLANAIAMHGNNVMDVVYDATDLEMWVAFAEGAVEAYLQPYVHLDLFDLDGDADGIADLDEGFVDSDGDGASNYLDTDSDGDGIDDIVEGAVDSDGDTTPDYLDEDSDDDGIGDAVEGELDSDGDTTPDYLDEDSDDDGISDADEGVDDVDLDLIPNYLDEDSDGDGYSDSEEHDMHSNPYDANSVPPTVPAPGVLVGLGLVIAGAAACSRVVQRR